MGWSYIIDHRAHKPKIMGIDFQNHMSGTARVIVAYRCSKFKLYCLLSCRNSSKLNLFPCRASVTLEGGQGQEEAERWEGN